MLKGLFIFTFVSFSAFSEVQISTSEKGVEVSLRDERDEVVSKFGTTPVSLKPGDLKVGHILVVEKSGFAPVYIPIMSEFKSDSKIRVKLKKLEEMIHPDLEKKTTDAAEGIIDQIFITQNLIEQKKYYEALISAENLRLNYPNSLAVKLVYSNALLMNGARDKALAHYNFILNELPPQRTLMRESIENLKKRIAPARQPASVKKGKE